MNILVVFGAVVFVTLTISETSALCCGRGKHGYCNDCAKTSLLGHRKCCGSGSGSGKGCNILCCNCGVCRQGTPIITYTSGWWLSKKYKCEEHDANSEVPDVDNLRDTWNVFNKLDTDNDNVISLNEFVDAITSGLADHENAQLVASDLLQSNDDEEIGDLLDAVAERESNEEDIARLIVQEFNEMDTDKDGLIQAQEFDWILK